MTSIANTHVAPPAVEVVIPVYNEERDLEPHVRRLHAFLERPSSRSAAASRSPTTRAPTAPGTSPARLQRELPHVAALHLDAEGPRPRAAGRLVAQRRRRRRLHGRRPLDRPARRCCRSSRRSSRGTATSRSARRLARGASVARGPKREVISRSYNGSCTPRCASRFSDAQCGFKAVRRDTSRELLPLIEDDAWFFDTELLVLAERPRPAHPRGARRLGRRPRLAGATSSRPPPKTCAASGACSEPTRLARRRARPPSFPPAPRILDAGHEPEPERQIHDLYAA